MSKQSPIEQGWTQNCSDCALVDREKKPGFLWCPLHDRIVNHTHTCPSFTRER